MELSNMLKGIQPQLARRLFDLSKQYDDVIDLTLGDPDFATPKNISETGCNAIMEGKTKYTANAGVIELRKAICDDIERRLNVKYDPNTEIICTIGAMGALYLATICLLNPEDEMIVLSPHWPNYTNMVKMCYGVPKYVDFYGEEKLKKLKDNLEKAYSEKTKCIIINSPSNPTGKILDKDTLKMIADFVKEHNLVVISDEVYHTITFNGKKHQSILQFDGMKERTILIDSLSKRFSMTGWRVGFAAAPKELINYMVQLNEDVAACVPMFSQYAAIEALNNGRESEKEICDNFYSRCKFLTEKLNEISKIHCPTTDGTFYLFIDIKNTGLTSEQFAYALLEKEHVAVVPGNAFNESGEGYIRIACTLSESKLAVAAQKIKHFVESL